MKKKEVVKNPAESGGTQPVTVGVEGEINAKKGGNFRVEGLGWSGTSNKRLMDIFLPTKTMAERMLGPSGRTQQGR